MKKQTEEFLKKIKEDREEAVKNLIANIYYYDKYLSEVSEDKLRDDLAEEEKKLVKDEKGRIVSDGRDFERKAEIEADINKLTKIKHQKLNDEDMLKDVRRYMDWICINPDKEMVSKLDSEVEDK